MFKRPKKLNDQQLFDKLSNYKQPKENEYLYDQDGLTSIHNHDFMKDPKFVKAYQRGVKAVGIDYHWHWRVHVFLWAFSQAMRLDGDFVECGVYKGFMFSAAFTYTDWNKFNKSAYLFDTFDGIDTTQLTEEEKKLGRQADLKDLYKKVYRQVVNNFKEFKNVNIIKGSVPSSLAKADIKKVAFLALDMNNATPEVAALKYFWPKMVDGAVCLMDDYAYSGYHPQKKALDELADQLGTEILSLPTGQGLLIKRKKTTGKAH